MGFSLRITKGHNMFKKRKNYLIFGSPLIEEPEIQERVV